MRVLLGCECSGVVRDEFIKLGHDAYSCDLKPCERDNKRHLQCDILEIINDGWDRAIFFPECKFLCFSGERWIKERPDRIHDRLLAFDFLKRLYYCKIPGIALENSHSVYLEQNFRKPDQKVHPYHFGDPFKKTICLWLRGLPPLIPTNILPIGKRFPAAWRQGPSKTRSTDRARTYPGIASAMADQWG